MRVRRPWMLTILLLLVLSKIYEPVIIEKTQDDLESLIALLQQELFEIRGETTVLERELTSREKQVSEEVKNVARLRGDLSSIQGRFRASRQLSSVSEEIEGRLDVMRSGLDELTTITTEAWRAEQRAAELEKQDDVNWRQRVIKNTLRLLAPVV